MNPSEREGLCQQCGKEYPVWFTSNDLWNAVTDHRSEKPFIHFICLNCFAFLAEEKLGISPVWELKRFRRKARIGEVWKNLDNGVVFVVRRIAMVQQIADGNYEYVAGAAHENDDFSYQCGKPHCRCMQ